MNKKDLDLILPDPVGEGLSQIKQRVQTKEEQLQILNELNGAITPGQLAKAHADYVNETSMALGMGGNLRIGNNKKKTSDAERKKKKLAAASKKRNRK